uniref:PITH domain-containing protein n=1 Tax=Heligmosomoides polygyrus TaxID=6339 RepID=A0A183F8X1_HELPZ
LGFSLTYPSIILHAVSTDLSTFPHECIYVLVDASKSERRRIHDIPLFTAAEARNVQDLKLAEEELSHNGNASDDDDEDEGKNVVIRFVPSDLSVLQQIYTEMCSCQELNPDENDDFSAWKHSLLSFSMVGCDAVIHKPFSGPKASRLGVRPKPRE